ncbi:MAG: rhomboid family intramembrane serine protease, partial [Deltaproteobacteria bacterium]
MIPLRDTVPSRSFPLMTLALIMVNTVVFLYELRLGPALERFLLIYGFVPVRFSEAESWNLPARFVPMFSSMFLHGSWLH